MMWEARGIFHRIPRPVRSAPEATGMGLRDTQATHTLPGRWKRTSEELIPSGSWERDTAPEKRMSSGPRYRIMGGRHMAVPREVSATSVDTIHEKESAHTAVENPRRTDMHMEATRGMRALVFH